MKTDASPARLITVKQLLENKHLHIPPYQRPYKWTRKHVNQLLDDILAHRHRSAYRLGTVVLHDDDGELHIVDGQQRTITLTLIALAIQERFTAKDLNGLQPVTPALQQLKLPHAVSQQNVRDNYAEISRRMAELDEHAIAFFYSGCQLVQVVIASISEAFQFFDSQNSRGRDLEPHDLLKAFHLRELAATADETVKHKVVSEWEALDTAELAGLFQQYLFRIRNWSKGHSARFFTKEEVGLFKGVSPQISEPYPFAGLYRIGHFYVDEYNRSYHRGIDKQEMVFPFQLDQVIINGRRFFEFVGWYSKRREAISNWHTLLPATFADAADAREILETLDTYAGRNRTGDRYLRNLFDCAVMYYVDKFGIEGLPRAIVRLFIWAYTLRLEMQLVKLASVDNYALEDPAVFKIIREAIDPSVIWNLPLNTVEKRATTDTGVLDTIFRKWGYYHE